MVYLKVVLSGILTSMVVYFVSKFLTWNLFSLIVMVVFFLLLYSLFLFIFKVFDQYDKSILIGKIFKSKLAKIDNGNWD